VEQDRDHVEDEEGRRRTALRRKGRAMGEDEVVPIGVMQEDEQSEGFVDVVRIVVGY